MNHLKKNEVAISLIEKMSLLNCIPNLLKDRKVTEKITFDENESTRFVGVPKDAFSLRADKVVRISDSIYELSKKISIDSIYKNIHEIDMGTRHLAILMPNDELGLLYVDKVLSDISILLVSCKKGIPNSEIIQVLNIFNFFSKDFLMSFENDEVKHLTEEVLKILVYLFCGDVTTKLCTPKMTIKDGFYSEYKNPSKTNIFIATSLWKTRISTSGFPVSGHFRLQPIGKNRINQKLIFIEEYLKTGYNRSATIESFRTS